VAADRDLIPQEVLDTQEVAVDLVLQKAAVDLVLQEEALGNEEVDPDDGTVAAVATDLEQL